MARPLRFIDIGANLTDPVFHGIYHGKHCHAGDLSDLLTRSFEAGMDKIIITGSDLDESSKALALAQTDDHLFCTVGCHPTHSKAIEAGGEAYIDKLLTLVREGAGKVVAIGELGLDYDRLHFSPADTQRMGFEAQLRLAETTSLPLFLHNRAATADFADILRRNRSRIPAGGVVHSFTGSPDELAPLLDLGLSIGINGCSLKTEENLEALKLIPDDRLMIEVSNWPD